MGSWLHRPWWGKLIGGLLGAALKGPLGALIGMIVGHLFDRGLSDREEADEKGPHGPSVPDPSISSASRQQLFFYTTFSVMGHIAKSDGRVSESEIAAASLVMKTWDLDEQQVDVAIRFFNQGKQKEFQLNPVLQHFREATGSHRPTLLTFVTAQLHIMLADHQIHPATRQRTWHVCRKLGVTRVEMAAIEAQLRGRNANTSIYSIEQAYKQLALAQNATDIDVKTAYRRMMNRYHPDKMIDSSHSEQERIDAGAQLLRCRDAYEKIKSSRGFR